MNEKVYKLLKNAAMVAIVAVMTIFGGKSARAESAPVASVTVGEEVAACQTLKEAFDKVLEKKQDAVVKLLENIDLTGTDWTPVELDGYNGNFQRLTVDGNGKTITGLPGMLFSKTWTGLDLTVKDLVLSAANIVNDANDAAGNVGVGAIVGYAQACKSVTIENVKLSNSHIEGGHWTGGFVGYAAGYSGSDGPVFTTVTVKDCAILNTEIVGKGSAGGVVGHATGDAWTSFVVDDVQVSGNTVTSSGSSNAKAGAIMGTVGAAGKPQSVNGETKTGGTTVNATVADNTVTSGVVDKGDSVF